jgi:hypothetical protein
MPRGKAAGERCIHLDANLRCELFDDPRRPRFCATFAAESAVCGNNRLQALEILAELEVLTLPPASIGGSSV